MDSKQLDARAAKLGWRIEHSKTGARIVDAQTGTLVAADWSKQDGFGLSAVDVERIIDEHTS
jgi:hypothetical protein